MQSPGPVAGDDMQADGKPLVITGANSGGKSTFCAAPAARLMTQCGLLVSHRFDFGDGLRRKHADPVLFLRADG